MTETTTEAVTQDAGATAQPDEQQAEAVQTPVSESTTPPESPAEEAAQAARVAESDKSDSDYVDFWAKKGIDINTTEGQAKAAKSYSEAEKLMHKTRQEQSELAKKLQEAPVDGVDTDNELLRQLVERDVQRDRVAAVEQFKQAAGLTPEQDEAMGAWLEKNKNVLGLVLDGNLTLDQAYKLSGIGEQDAESLKKAGEKEALAKLATKQRTSAPKAGATVQTTPTEDPIMAALLSDD